MLRWIAARAAIVVAGLTVAALLGEIGVRLIGPIRSQDLLPFPYRYDQLRRVTSGATYIRFDSHLGWSSPPSTTSEADGVVYRSNAASLRAEREYSVDPPPGARRLAAFGDSFTHCNDVENFDCWTVGIEQAWPGTEVLNFGVSGYGPDQAWLRYERDGRAYRPCAVLIGYMTENINRVVNRFRPFYAREAGHVLSKPRFLLDGDDLRLLPNPATGPELLEDPRWVEETLGPNDGWYFPGMFVPNPLDVSHIVRLARTAAYNRHVSERGGGYLGAGRDLTRAYREDQESYQVTGRILLHFARQVRQDGATPVVVVFGTRPDVAAMREGRGKVYASLLDWLEREGVPTIDVTDRLAREALRTDASRLFTRFGHYSPAGNQIVAATLARQLPELVGATCGAG